jgi:hypothetical protein
MTFEKIATISVSEAPVPRTAATPASSSAGRSLGRATMKYNAWQGENKPKNWPGPGTVYAGFSRDETNWDFWSKWFSMLTHDEG